ncbi:MFS transporter [Hydrogenophaga sp.]|jgi:EmrB/QacA subfamily drug resistance transporter|uniref:MFS transporter n=1 Tax=Hydrogenophaga sp. TaxID=1904254 RepID=UPI003F6ED327
MPQMQRGLPIVVGIAFFMEQLDATIIAPAIPDIATAFQTDPLNLNLTMTVYLMCGVAFIPVGGLLASRWGTRTVFQGAMALFVVSSVLCALSTNLIALCAARALQGVAAALMVPVGRIAIVRNTPRAELVKALAWMITPAMLGPLLGPPLGGLLTTWLTWHWIFLINVPIGLAVLWGARVYVPQIFLETPGRFDVVSWLLLAVALACAILGLEMLRHGTPTLHWLVFGALLVFALGGYARRSRRVSTPLLDFSLLSTATFRISLVAGSLLRVGYGALPFLLPLMLQLSLGLSALESGMALLATGAVAFLTKTQTTWMLRRWGFRRVLLVNGVFCAAALFLCGLFRVGWGLPVIAGVAALAGFVRAIQFNALAAIAYADLPMDKVAPATTLNTMAQQLSVTIGISVASLVVAWSSRMAGRSSPSAEDFSIAFYALALIGAAAIPSYLAVRRDAGQALSGHTARN